MSPDPFELSPTPRRVLVDDVVDAIRDAILSGRIPPGARLIEEDLATMLKVSRGPVRQAIFRLHGEGLVVHEPHRGASVVGVSEEDISDIYGLRTALERLAAEQACLRADETDLAAMDAVLERFERAPRDAITRQFVARLDVEFHDALFRASHSPRLFRAWETLRSQLMLFLMLRDALPDDYPDSWLRDHRKLFAAVRSREGVKAAALIEKHIGSARERLLGILRASGRIDVPTGSRSENPK